MVTSTVPSFDLAYQGIDTDAVLYWNLLPAALTEHAIRRGEGVLGKDGPLVVTTGKHTGRSAKDKFIVRDGETEDNIGGTTTPACPPSISPCLRGNFWPH